MSKNLPKSLTGRSQNASAIATAIANIRGGEVERGGWRGEESKIVGTEDSRIVGTSVRGSGVPRLVGSPVVLNFAQKPLDFSKRKNRPLNFSLAQNWVDKNITGFDWIFVNRRKQRYIASGAKPCVAIMLVWLDLAEELNKKQ